MDSENSGTICQRSSLPAAYIRTRGNQKPRHFASTQTCWETHRPCTILAVLLTYKISQNYEANNPKELEWH